MDRQLNAASDCKAHIPGMHEKKNCDTVEVSSDPLWKRLASLELQNGYNMAVLPINLVPSLCKIHSASPVPLTYHCSTNYFCHLPTQLPFWMLQLNLYPFCLCIPHPATLSKTKILLSFFFGQLSFSMTPSSWPLCQWEQLLSDFSVYTFHDVTYLDQIDIFLVI